MSTAMPIQQSNPIPLGQVESELARQLTEGQGQGQGKAAGSQPLLRARLSNLMIFCNAANVAETVTQAVPEIVALHPARVLLLVGESGVDAELTANLNVWSQLGSKCKICSEMVSLRAGGQHVNQLPFAVRQLTIGDLPVNLWWAAPTPPPLAGQFLYELAEYAQQIIYDSIGWLEPARGVAAAGAWLAKVERSAGDGRWRVAADLNWRRLKFWRRMLSQALDPNTAPGALESITEVLVEHGPHSVVQAWELVGWLASRLGWKVELAKVELGVEISWKVVAPHGSLRVRIRRLTEGPSEVRKVRISCTLGGAPHVLNIAIEKGMRLAVVVEGLETEPRTVAVQQSSLAELVVNQLSSRQRDPVFRESMGLAEVFARTVLLGAST